MHTNLAPSWQHDVKAQRAAELIQSCVHCGFCTATCPSYQVLGHEMDSPRGRIDLIREVLQGEPPLRATQVHLDRCLTCRGCESTCPSGVRYGELVEIGRHLVEQTAPPRPRLERWKRAVLARFLPSRAFAWALTLGRWVRPLAPQRLRRAIPAPAPVRHSARVASQPRQVLLLRGCVQGALAPNIEAATQRVLAAVGTQGLPIEGCCGAVRAHLGDERGAQRDIEALVARCAGRPEPIVSNASGCGLMVQEYPLHQPGDAAQDVAARTQDLGVWLLTDSHIERLRARMRPGPLPRLAWHPPCTLQHGQRKADAVEQGLRALGFEVLLPQDSHLCCGSAGTYSVLQPAVAQALRARKRATLGALHAEVIVSANIGCLTHLAEEDGVPVRHWIEVVADCLR
ncbi:glycolate oxidase subunit GlcF [Inhella gelatinilytica]|uniref:Glycolate oxidase iron-sulfur subunit n=1 Tax=Inhella gelatinilytica TaxID=2795030 RepID=A0A931NEV5_9BURK|nr:glycolate oxidase subunit GlcF [Inhella gelatinilytica]MBH9553610.1 glycolate oxidase subunit GlcF [Inhella gelatinilytica]